MGSNESRKAIYVKSFSQILKHTRHNTKIGELCFLNSFEDDYSSPPFPQGA